MCVCVCVCVNVRECMCVRARMKVLPEGPRCVCVGGLMMQSGNAVVLAELGCEARGE